MGSSLADYTHACVLQLPIDDITGRPHPSLITSQGKTALYVPLVTQWLILHITSHAWFYPAIVVSLILWSVNVKKYWYESSLNYSVTQDTQVIWFGHLTMHIFHDKIMPVCSSNVLVWVFTYLSVCRTCEKVVDSIFMRILGCSESISSWSLGWGLN